MRRPGPALTLAVLGMGALLLLVYGQRAVGLVALAGVAGVLATTGLLRRLVGVVLGLMGVLALVTTRGSWGAVVGAVLVLLAAATVVLFAHTWPGLSRRYGRTASAGRDASDGSPTDLWKALDRGDDPTAAPEDGQPPVAPR